MGKDTGSTSAGYLRGILYRVLPLCLLILCVFAAQNGGNFDTARQSAYQVITNDLLAPVQTITPAHTAAPAKSAAPSLTAAPIVSAAPSVTAAPAISDAPDAAGDINQASLSEAPPPGAQEAEYIGNKNSKIFHIAKCGSVASMKETNKVPFAARDDAANAGYVPCKRCKP